MPAVKQQQGTFHPSIDIILNSITEGMYGIDMNGNCTFINKAGAEILGYSSEECLGKNMHELVHYRYRDGQAYSEACCPIDKSKYDEAGCQVDDEVFWRRDGSSFDVRYSSNPILDQGIAKGAVITFNDITQEKLNKQALDNAKAEKLKIEKQLQLSEQRFKSLVQEGSDLIGILDQEANYKYVSPTVKAILSMEPDEFTAKNAFDFIHPLDKDAVLSDFSHLQEQNQVKTSPFRFKHKNGGWRWVETVLTDLTADPAIQGIVANSRDITERIKAEEELKNSEQKYRMLFHFNPLPIWIYDYKTLQILDVNETALVHYGYSREEFLSKTIKDIRPAEEIETVISIFKNLAVKDQIIRFGIFNHLKKDGSPIKVDIFGYRLNYQNKECVMAVCNDVTEREKALVKLKENEAKLLSAQKIGKLGYWQSHLENDTLYWSDEVYSIWGLSKETFKDNYPQFVDTIYPEDREQFLKEQKAALQNEKELDYEHRIILPDGSIKWVHEKGKLVTDETGKPVIFEGTVQDITESKIAWERLQISEARHRGIFESQTNYVIRTDLEGNYTYCNNKFIKDFAWLYTDGEIIGKESILCIQYYHRAQVMETVEKCFHNLNKAFQVEIDKPRENGGVRTTLWDLVCLTDSKGQPTELQGIGIDISDRKKAELAITKAMEEKNQILESIGDAFFAVDENWLVNYWNKQAENILYGPKDKVLGHNLWDVFSNSIDSLSYKNYHQAIETKQAHHFEDYYEPLNKWFEISAYPANRGLSVYFKDITKRKISEAESKLFTAELYKRNKELQQFGYVVSHNLRSPVANILGLINLLEMDKEDPQTVETCVKELTVSVNRLDNVIKDLSQILSITDGSVELTKEMVDLTEILANVQLDLKEAISYSKANIYISAKIKLIFSHKAYLYSVFYNLLSNGIKYRSERAPEIKINITGNAESIIIVVSDNGIGIDLEKHKEELFKPYKRFNRRAEGKGLGLFLIKSHIEALNGNVDIKSNLGVGTTFTITLPIVKI
jgi:PAS domain S-box-containing protein